MKSGSKVLIRKLRQKGFVTRFNYEDGIMKRSEKKGRPHRKVYIRAVTVPVLLSVFFLFGCGSDNNEETSNIAIDKDGKISYVMVEDFSKDYYSLDELESMVRSELEIYNDGWDEPHIILETSELIAKDDDSKVKLSLSFETSDDFTAFNEDYLYYGTIEEALGSGYSLSPSLVDKDGNPLEDGFFDDNQGLHIIITNSKTGITCPYNISYMSKGITLNGKKEAVLSDTLNDEVQLILSK